MASFDEIRPPLIRCTSRPFPPASSAIAIGVAAIATMFPQGLVKSGIAPSVGRSPSLPGEGLLACFEGSAQPRLDFLGRPLPGVRGYEVDALARTPGAQLPIREQPLDVVRQQQGVKRGQLKRSAVGSEDRLGADARELYAG